MKKHASSKKHENNITAAQVPSVYAMASIKNNEIIENDVKTAEIRIASFIAEHNIAINSSDHLVQLIKSLPLNSNSQKKIQCNRTKAH